MWLDFRDRICPGPWTPAAPLSCRRLARFAEHRIRHHPRKRGAENGDEHPERGRDGTALRLERAPCARELAAALDWPIADLFHAMLAAGAGGLRAGDPPIEALDDAAEAAPGAGLHLRVGGSPRQRLSALLSGFFDLGDREQLVLLMLADRRMAHDDAARAFGDTTERVRQLHDGAVGKLLRHLTATPASH